MWCIEISKHGGLGAFPFHTEDALKHWLWRHSWVVLEAWILPCLPGDGNILTERSLAWPTLPNKGVEKYRRELGLPSEFILVELNPLKEGAWYSLTCVDFLNSAKSLQELFGLTMTQKLLQKKYQRYANNSYMNWRRSPLGTARGSVWTQKIWFSDIKHFSQLLGRLQWLCFSGSCPWGVASI